MQSYLVKLVEVHPSGTTATPFSFSDSLVLPWPLRDHRPRDIPRGIDQFFDVLGVLNNRLGWWAHLQRKFHFTDFASLHDYGGIYQFTVLVTGYDV
jgi:hypothetical protein